MTFASTSHRPAKKCGVYSYIQPGKDEAGDWRFGLARAKATKNATRPIRKFSAELEKSGMEIVCGMVSYKKPQQISNITSEHSNNAYTSFGDIREVEADDVFAMKLIPKTEVLDYCITFRHLASERATLERSRDHPYPMHLSFAFQMRDHLFLGMPLCAGDNLVCYMYRSVPPRVKFSRWHHNCCRNYFNCPRLSEDSVRRIAAQVIVAMQTLHSWGILYRDVKPENILIDTDGNILLSDYGLTRTLPDVPHEDVLAGMSMDRMTICGTEICMAPEARRELLT